MKTLKLISIRLLLASGLFFNATAQGDVAEVDINKVNNDSNQVAMTGVELENSGETETFSLLPAAVKQTLSEEYENFILVKAEEIETSVREAYKVRIISDNESWDVFISQDAEILMEEKITLIRK